MNKDGRKQSKLKIKQKVKVLEKSGSAFNQLFATEPTLCLLSWREKEGNHLLANTSNVCFWPLHWKQLVFLLLKKHLKFLLDFQYQQQKYLYFSVVKVFDVLQKGNIMQKDGRLDICPQTLIKLKAFLMRWMRIILKKFQVRLLHTQDQRPQELCPPCISSKI